MRYYTSRLRKRAITLGRLNQLVAELGELPLAEQDYRRDRSHLFGI